MSTLDDLLQDDFTGLYDEESVEDKAMSELKARITSECEQYLDTPVTLWPTVTFNWDVSKESQCFSLDGYTQNKFLLNYPDGFLLGYVSLAEFDKRLCHYSRRDEGELWELGSRYGLARLIVYLSEGRPISPPLVKPVEDGELIFQGGHHRYAIAKVTGVDLFPIYVEPHYKSEIDKRIKVQWENAQ